MSNISLSQVTLFAVGVENYQYMPTLRGPEQDVEKFIDVLIRSPRTGLYELSQLIKLINPDSNKLRNSLNEYVTNRSAPGDVIIFYFSGHGIPVGQNDFGFCTSDSRIHDVTGSILPLSVLRFVIVPELVNRPETKRLDGWPVNVFSARPSNPPNAGHDPDGYRPRRSGG